LSYWHGIDLFANIPMVTENDPLGSTPPQQATRADIYTYVVSELNDINSQLPPKGASTYGRATPEAAHMLLAKLYLNAGVYSARQTTPARSRKQRLLSPAATRSIRASLTTSRPITTPPRAGVRRTARRRQDADVGGMTFLIHAGCGAAMSAGTYGVDYCWGGTV